MFRISIPGPERNCQQRFRPTRWRGALLLTLPLLSGCALVAPPYQPIGYSQQEAGKPSAAVLPVCQSGGGGALLVFTSFNDAAGKLCQIGIGYADQRNAVMVQRLLFDLPAIGLGIATAANGAFHGAKDLTLGLGIGSAGVAGASLYFSPATRVTAYNSASKALLCASSVSSQMGLIAPGAQPSAGLGDGIAARLADKIAAAAALVADGPQAATRTQLAITKDNIKDVMAARDNATKAQSDLAAANGLLYSGPGQLQAFATQVISSATDKVVSGTQNVDAVLSLVKAQMGGGTSLASTTAPKMGMALSPRTTPTKATPPENVAADLIAALNQEANLAAAFAKRVNDAWSGYSKCSSS